MYYMSTWENDCFTEVCKNLDKYRSENNFAGPSK